MKKLLAVLFCVAILATCMAVPAFAEGSPSGKPVYKVEVESFASGSSTSNVHTVVEGDTVKLTTDENSKHTFTGWVIEGVEGVDYEIVSGSLKSETIVIRPLADIKVEESYDVKGSAGEGTTNDSDKAPETGNSALALAVLAVAGAFVVMVSTKKAVKA